MDDHLLDALRWLKSKTRIAYSHEGRTIAGLTILPLADAISDGSLQDKKFILLHKGRLRELEMADMANIASRSEISFSNDVYVALKVRSITRERNAVKSFHVYLSQLKRAMSISATPPTPSGRFCHYIGNDTVLTETYFKRKIFLDSTDISLTPHIMYNGQWEPWVTQFIASELGQGDVVIDIGANCGFFTLLAAHLVGPSGFVIAVEPQAKLRQLVEKSIAVNGFGGFVATRQTAVGQSESRARLHQHYDFRGSASLLGGAGGGGEEVTIQPLPDILADIGRQFGREFRPTFFKIDVEGFEISVWRGMRDWLSSAGRLTIITEFSPASYLSIGEDPVAYVQDMLSCGFRVSRLFHDATERPFGVDHVEEIVATGSYADLVLRRD